MERDAIEWYLPVFGVVWLVAGAAGCSADDSNGDAGASSGSGAAASGSTGTGGGTSDGTSTSGGSAGTSGATATGAGGAAGAQGEGGAAGESGFTRVGVCGQRGEATVDTEETFEGFQEYYIIDDSGLGDDICVVRFDVERAGDAPGGCEMFAGQQDECLWTHLVELKNPMITLDENGVCENSELGLDAAALMEIDGSQVAYGFVSQYAGHNSVLLKYDDSSETWVPNGNATWDPETGAFRFDRRDGFCNY